MTALNRLATIAIPALVLTVTPLAVPRSAAGQEQARPLRPVHTYSIVARDAETGELGVAVQSHWFSVGSSVVWAGSGVGAVATQSFIDPSYGANGLILMSVGKTASETLAGLTRGGRHPEVRQVGMVDASGGTAVHTGSLAIAEACDYEGERIHGAGQPDAPPHRVRRDGAGLHVRRGDLAERLMSALEAARS